MPNNDLKERVKSLFASRPADPRFTEVFRKLEEVAQAIAESGVSTIRCNDADELESEIVRLLGEANVPSRLQMLA